MGKQVLRQAQPINHNDDGSFTIDGTGISFYQDDNNKLFVYRSDTQPMVLLYTQQLLHRIV